MLELYKPTIDDLWFKQLMLQDEDTMSFNRSYGGTIPFNKDKWRAWFDKWMNNEKRFYRYLRLTDTNEFVGEVAYYFDEERKTHLANIIIYSKYRKLGYGKQGLKLLCDIAKDNHIDVLYDDIAIDNPSIKLFIDCGFIEKSRTKKSIIVYKNLY